MDYTLYTFGAGEVLHNLFNGIASLIGSSSYLTLIKISLLFGLIYVLFESVFRQQFMLNVRWFISFFMVYQILLVPKVTLHIDDAVTKAHFVVGNVPWGLALFSSVSSLIGYSITLMTESVFSLPDDLKYNQTGNLMASQMIRETLAAKISNPTFAKHMQHFTQQCVFYDLLLGKYSLDDLIKNGNTWDLITHNTSKARAFRYENKIVTCKEGIGLLSLDFEKEINNTSLLLGKKLFSNTVESRELFIRYLPIATHYLMNLSQTSNEVIQQTLISNALLDGVIKQGAKLNSEAAIDSFALLRANHLKESTYLITGKLASRWLSTMKNVFEALFYGSFLFLALLFLLPWGLSILKGYVFSLFWLQSWAPLYAVLNLVMTINAKSSLTALSLEGITLANLHNLSQINSDTIALAGFLSMSIPFIAYGIVKGGASSFVHLASHMGSVSQQAATRAGEEMTSGNYSFGNTQLANHSMVNTHAYSYQTNPTLQSGMAVTQLPSGTLVNRTAEGKTVLNAHAAISETASHINFANSLHHLSSNQEEKAVSLAMQQADSYSDNLTKAFNNIMEVSKTSGQSQSYESSVSKSNTGQWSKSFQKIEQAIQDFRKDTHFTSQQAARLLANAMVELEVGKGMKMPLGNAGFGLKIGAGMDGNQNSEFSRGFHKAKSFIEQTHFADTVEEAMRVSKDSQTRLSDENTHRQLNAISQHFDKALAYRTEYSQSLQEAMNYRELMSVSSDATLSLNSNLAQGFVDWLAKDKTLGGQGLSAGEIDTILNRNPSKMGEYANNYLSELIKKMGSGDLSFDINSKALISNAFNKIKEDSFAQTKNHFSSQNLINQDSTLKEMRSTHQSLIDKDFNKIAEKLQRGKNTIEETQSLSNKIDNTLKENENHLVREVFKNTLNNENKEVNTENEKQGNNHEQ